VIIQIVQSTVILRDMTMTTVIQNVVQWIAQEFLSVREMSHLTNHHSMIVLHFAMTTFVLPPQAATIVPLTNVLRLANAYNLADATFYAKLLPQKPWSNPD
jgi:hypothetical protein